MDQVIIYYDDQRTRPLSRHIEYINETRYAYLHRRAAAQHRLITGIPESTLYRCTP